MRLPPNVPPFPCGESPDPATPGMVAYPTQLAVVVAAVATISRATTLGRTTAKHKQKRKKVKYK